MIATIGTSAGGRSDDDVATTATTAAPATSEAPAAGTDGTAAPAKPKTTTATRVDAQKEDKESTIGGEGVRFSGYTATVHKAAFQQSVCDFETDGYVVAEVTVVNRDDATQPFSVSDWSLQTPQGQVLDFHHVGRHDRAIWQPCGWRQGVGQGRLGGRGGEGRFHAIIYKPDAFDAARGIWSMTV